MMSPTKVSRSSRDSAAGDPTPATDDMRTAQTTTSVRTEPPSQRLQKAAIEPAFLIKMPVPNIVLKTWGG